MINFRLIAIVCLLLFPAFDSFPQGAEKKTVEQLVEELKSDDRELSDASMNELSVRKEKALSPLTALAERLTENPIIRARAIIILGRIRDKNSAPVLIKLLEDKDSYVRGTSAYALSQIGGEEAKLSLLAFLEKCLESDHENLPRVTEAFIQLPDSRAFPLLMKIVKIGSEHPQAPASPNTEKDIVRTSTLRYAVEALGEIGDARASGLIAQLLDPVAPDVYSLDPLYLEAIRKTKGEEALPYLVAYLKKLVEKMKQQTDNDKDGMVLSNFDKNNYNEIVYKKILNCLEAITGGKSEGATREDVLIFWQECLNNRSKIE